MTAERSQFGTLADGTTIEAVTLSNDAGLRARIIAYGATLQALEAPDRDGRIADIVLGYDDLAAFVERPNYFGPTIGRYANRIANGAFVLDGTTYRVPCNDGGHALHGGAEGFDRRVWRIVDVVDGTVASVTLALTSPDGDQGFPGTLEAQVTYALDADNQLAIDFVATTDAPTIVNLTNHAIFNLGGEDARTGILEHVLVVPASAFTPVDAALIPTGERRAVERSVFDFRSGRTLGDGVRDGSDAQIAIGRGYDHNFALDAGLTAAPKLAARLTDPASGRVLEVLTTEPGLQVYTGNFLDGTRAGKNGRLYRQGDGIALEPQKFPDSPNQPGFASARIDPGQRYHHRMILRLSTAD